MASLQLGIPQQDLAFNHRTKDANPPSDSKLPPRVRGGRRVDDLQQLKTTNRTLLKELLNSNTIAAFGSLHGSSAAKGEAAQSRGWSEKPDSKLQLQTLFGEMHRPLSITCATACHQQDSEEEESYGEVILAA